MPDSAPFTSLILLVEDDENDAALVKRAFERAGVAHTLKRVSDGQEAIAYLKGDRPYSDRTKHPLPSMVLLDIKMPLKDGFEVLRWVRQQPEFAKLCVVMLTSSDEIRDVNKAYTLGATSFLVKPLDFWNAADLANSIKRLLKKPAG